jgi:hypothetical protein
VRERRTKAYEPLGDFGPASYALLPFFVELADELGKAHVRDEMGRSILQATDIAKNGTRVSGRLIGGDYGYSAELVDIDTYKHVHKRQPHHAELLPFFFMVDAPADVTEGVLLLQRFGTHGVFTAFARHAQERFDDTFDGYKLDIKRHLPKEVVDSILKGKLKRIELTSRFLPNDVADRVKLSGHREEVGKYSLEIRAKKDGFLTTPAWLDKLLKNPSKLYELPPGISEIAQQVRVSLTYKGKERVVDFASLEQLAPYVDVTAEVKFGKDGHPTLESMNAASVDLLNEIKSELGHGDVSDD